MPSYYFREIAPIANSADLDPQVVGEEIARIAAEHGDDLPDALWQAARNRRHPLHNCYEWDVQRAAEAHWRDTSRRIIRSIVVVRDEAPEPIPAFISVSTEEAGRRYYPAEEIVDNGGLQIAMMRAAQRDIEAFRRRYRALGFLCDDLNRMIRKLDAELRGGDADDGS